MIIQGLNISKWGKNVYVKVPVVLIQKANLWEKLIKILNKKY